MASHQPENVMNLEAIRQQVSEATRAALEAWCIGRCKLALWNCETGDRTHFE
jgi:hypothetical protein